MFFSVENSNLQSAYKGIRIADLRNSAINTTYHKSYKQSLPLQFRCAARACDKHHAISQMSLPPDCPPRFYSNSRESPSSSFAVNAFGLESFAGDYTGKWARGPCSSPTGSPADWDNYTADSAPRNLCWSSAFLSQVALSCTARRLGREPDTRGSCTEPALRQCRSKKYRFTSLPFKHPGHWMISDTTLVTRPQRHLFAAYMLAFP